MRVPKHPLKLLRAMTMFAILPVSPLPPPAFRAAEAIKPILPQAPTVQAPQPSVWVLDPSEKVWSLSINTKSRLVVRQGDVVVNSTHPNALWLADGTLQVQKGNIKVVGGVNQLGENTVKPEPQHLDQPVSDPIPTFTIPGPSELISPKQLFLPPDHDLTLQPGTYTGGVFVTGKGHITMAPGIYTINSGDFFVSGPTVTGQGVTLVLAGDKPGKFTCANGSHVDLTAPADGVLKGIVLISRAKGWDQISLTGTRARFNGLVYAPEAGMSIYSDSNVSLPRIVSANLGLNNSSYLEVSGNATPDAAGDYVPQDTGPAPTAAEQAAGQ